VKQRRVQFSIAVSGAGSGARYDIVRNLNLSKVTRPAIAGVYQIGIQKSQLLDTILIRDSIIDRVNQLLNAR
jgi:hypothetical protein